jgi:phosphoserine phosphatase
VALLSGGFTSVIERLLDGVVDSTEQRGTAGLAVDEIRANTLEIVDGRLTGRVLGEIVGPREKARHLAEIAAGHGVSAQRTIAVGDGANDALMLESAAVGVAFCAKPALREHADLVVDERDLRVVWDRARGLLAGEPQG